MKDRAEIEEKEETGGVRRRWNRRGVQMERGELEQRVEEGRYDGGCRGRRGQYLTVQR